MSKRRQRNVQQSSSSSPLLNKHDHDLKQKDDDHIFSITQLWTLPRTTLLIITPILSSTILQVSPQYVEPVYGNVFSSLYFERAVFASLLFGIVIGIGFAFKLPPKIRDRTLIFGIDWCGIIFALSPLSM